ncbi:hypothetical protein [Citrobacter meridianamericanus]|uniref:hypothetical protein n=1 Tax=Citrobacter meridianamericanus TaxID=2894201 RepID=UPI00351CD5BC
MLAFTGHVLMMAWILRKTAYSALQNAWQSVNALRENFHVTRTGFTSFFHVTAQATTDERHALETVTRKCLQLITQLCDRHKKAATPVAANTTRRN